MAPSFPGMNPYLENPSLWSEVHSWLIVELARALNPHYTQDIELLWRNGCTWMLLYSWVFQMPSVFQQNP
jgi:hypothetical protein